VSEHDVMTAEEAATYLRIARATLYRLAAKGGVPAVKVGRVWRFSRQLLDWTSGLRPGCGRTLRAAAKGEAAPLVGASVEVA